MILRFPIWRSAALARRRRRSFGVRAAAATGNSGPFQEMAIYRLLREASFDDLEVKMTRAYEGALQDLLADRSDPITEIVAHRIIELARMGERDPDCLRQLVLQSLRR